MLHLHAESTPAKQALPANKNLHAELVLGTSAQEYFMLEKGFLRALIILTFPQPWRLSDHCV